VRREGVDGSAHAPYITEVNRRAMLLLVILVPFVVFSATVIAAEGFGGLFGLVLRERWGMQMFLDLVILYGLFCAWLVPDARGRGITPWPYVAATLTLGAMGALAYLIRRELRC
jgi:hypothetical protein